MNVHVFNGGDCQKCGMNLASFLSNLFNYGLSNIHFTDSAMECDLLIILGCVTKTQIEPLMKFWKKMPRNHRILSLGTCGTEFQDLFLGKEGEDLKNRAIPKEDISELVPIDFVLKGCPPTLEDLSNFFHSIKKTNSTKE